MKYNLKSDYIKALDVIRKQLFIQESMWTFLNQSYKLDNRENTGRILDELREKLNDRFRRNLFEFDLLLGQTIINYS